MKRVGLHPSEEGCNRLTICYCSDLFLHSSLFCLLRRAILPVCVCQRAQRPRSPLALPCPPTRRHRIRPPAARGHGSTATAAGSNARPPTSLLARTQARSPPPTKPLGRGVRPAGRRARPHPRREECGPVADQHRARARGRARPGQARPGQAQPPTGPSRQSSAQRALLLGSPRTSASTAGCGTALAVAAKGGSCPSASPSSSPCAAPPPVSC